MDFGGDNVQVEGPVDLTDVISDVLPRDNCIYDVGSAAKRFKSAHFCEGNFKPDANSTTSFRIERKVSGSQEPKMFNVNSSGNVVDVGNDGSTINIGDVGSTVNIAGLSYPDSSTYVSDAVGGTLPLVLADGSIPGQVDLRIGSNLSYITVGDGTLQTSNMNVNEKLLVQGDNSTTKFLVKDGVGNDILRVNTVADTVECPQRILVEGTNFGDKFRICRADASDTLIADTTNNRLSVKADLYVEGDNSSNKIRVENSSGTQVLDLDTSSRILTLNGRQVIDNYAGGFDSPFLIRNSTLAKIFEVDTENEIVNIQGNVLPDGGGIRTIGDASNLWNTVYAKNLRITDETVQIDGNNSTSKFRIINDNVNDVFLVDTTNDNIRTRDISPIAADTFDIGTSGNRFQNIYSNVVDLSGSMQVEGNGVLVDVRDITSTTTFSVNTLNNRVTTNARLVLKQTGADDHFVYVAGTEVRLENDTNGDSLRVRAGVYLVDSSPNVSLLGTSSVKWEAVWAVDGTINTSSEKTKKEIEECDRGRDFIKKLKPKKYRYKDVNSRTKSKRYGLIAEDIAQVLQEEGKTLDDFNGLRYDEDPITGDKEYGIIYTEFIPILIQSVKELNAEVEDLRKEIRKIKNK